MAQYTVEQQKQQEEAAGYSQLPGPSPAAVPVAGAMGQQFYPAAAPPQYPSLAGPCSSTACAPMPTYPPYPPQQFAVVAYAQAPAPAPAPGMAVTGYPAGPQMHHMQPMSVGAAPVQGSPTVIDQEPCGCTVGWVLFGIGWLFPICWVVGAFLPFCSKSRNDRRAAIASGIMIAISIVIVVLAVAIPLGILASAARDITLTANHNGYNMTDNSYSYAGGPFNSNN